MAVACRRGVLCVRMCAVQPLLVAAGYRLAPMEVESWLHSHRACTSGTADGRGCRRSWWAGEGGKHCVPLPLSHGTRQKIRRVRAAGSASAAGRPMADSTRARRRGRRPMAAGTRTGRRGRRPMAAGSHAALCRRVGGPGPEGIVNGQATAPLGRGHPCLGTAECGV